METETTIRCRPGPPQCRMQPIYTTPQRLLLDLVQIFLGSALCAIAVNGILIPKNFATGGITGLSLVIHNSAPFLNLGLIYLLINIPLFLLAWMSIGRRFFVYSIVGTLTFALAVAFIHYPVRIEDKILAALLAGLIYGSGAGIALRSSGSQGGLDILSVMLLRRFSMVLEKSIWTPFRIMAMAWATPLA